MNTTVTMMPHPLQFSETGVHLMNGGDSRLGNEANETHGGYLNETKAGTVN